MQGKRSGHMDLLYKKIKDVSCEFDEFRVNTRLCKLRCWYLKYTMWVSFILMGGVLFFCFIYICCFSLL